MRNFVLFLLICFSLSEIRYWNKYSLNNITCEFNKPPTEYVGFFHCYDKEAKYEADCTQYIKGLEEDIVSMTTALECDCKLGKTKFVLAGKNECLNLWKGATSGFCVSTTYTLSKAIAGIFSMGGEGDSEDKMLLQGTIWSDKELY